MIQRRFLRTTAVALVLASQSIATTGTAETPADTFVISSRLAVTSLDPAGSNQNVASEITSNLYDNLVRLDQEAIREVRPMLADAWTVGEDGAITFALRGDVTFATGRKMTAADIAWSIHRVLKVDLIGAGDAKEIGFTAENVEAAVQAVDDTTLRIAPPKPVDTNLVLYILASAPFGIVDREVVMANEVNGDMGQEWLKGNAAGSGPYTLNTWRPQEILVADRRDGYWRGAPAMARVVMRHNDESGTRRLQLEAGDIDAAQYLSAGDLAALETSPDIEIQKPVGYGFYYVALNMKDPDLAKPLVREAFQYLYDWETLCATTAKYKGFPRQSIIPEGMPGAPGDTPRYRYDPEKACALLKEAGYPDGLKKQLHSGGAPFLPDAEALQATARKGCVELEVIAGENVPLFRAREQQVYLGSSGGRMPDALATILAYANNPDNSQEANNTGSYLWRTAWAMPELQALVDQFKVATDPDERARLTAEIDTMYMSNQPTLIPFFQRTDPVATRANVEGYQYNSTWSTRWFTVTKE